MFKKQFKISSIDRYAIKNILTYCLKCRKDTENKNPKKPVVEK